MIRIDRSKTAAPEDLKKPYKKTGLDERTAAIIFFTLLRNAPAPEPAAPGEKKKKEKKETFSFEAYKAPAVVKAMEELFLGKCAYCESYYAHIHPADREHWRPKSEVIIDDDGKERRPYGYYWLASDWYNLLPSCIDCNRVREHIDFEEKKKISIGKGNWFPIEPGTKRAEAPGEENAEKPLLINPCTDEPGDYLEFSDEGVVRPKLDMTKKPDAKAVSSIRVYALNREELVRERLKIIQKIKQKMETICNFVRLRAILLKNGLPTDDADNSIKLERQLLEKFKNPEEPYSLMATQIINVLEIQFKEELEGK